ncbi:MAG: MFS transporter [Methylophilaceae bacterium 17-44-8]|nr:MAG: MFS transporter [Methylophilales bacterium 28-44-11]OYZ10328.1 MAG: MFS transporter [Methylophilales bacterium 16-45-7]OZA05265.1 MAG: MFS transporter [Methylophilaceae bacterium 17-44-8]
MQHSIPQLFRSHQFAFVKLLAFRIQMVLAYQMMAVVVGWHIYELTHDPLALGLIGLAEVIPYFSCALFAGHAVDHYYSRRAFAILAASLLCLNALTLTAISLGWISGDPTVWIYSSIAFTGIARAFIAPSYNTLFAIIVPRASFARGAGVGSSIFQIGLVIGPALGGLLVGFASKTMAYALASALCAGAVVAMLMLKVKEPPAQTGVAVFKSIGEGLRFVWGNQIVFGAQMLDMFAVLFGGAVALLPAFVHDVYQMGPEGLGVLRAAPAVGAIATGLWLTKHPINLHAGRWLLGAVAGFGACMIGFALSPYFWLAVAILMLSGVLDGISVVMRQTILQLATPDGMRGRVSAINGIFIGSSNELGAFESGVAAKLLGLVPSVIFGGMITISIVGLTAKLAPKLRDLELKQLH